MSSIISSIGNTHIWWLPILIVCAVVFIGLVVGAMNGLKTALYFFVVNVVAWISAIFSFAPLYKLSFITKEVTKIAKELDFKDVNILEKPLMIIYILCCMLIMNLIALFIYIFIRKYLKKKIRKNKEYGKSNLVSRILGMSIGVITTVPFATFITTTTSLITTQGKMDQINYKVTEILTFNKTKHISEIYKTIQEHFHDLSKSKKI